MFGTIARLKPKPGQEQALLDFGKRWEQDRGSSVDGYIAEYVFKSDKASDDYLLVALFKDRDSYFANAHDPEQDRWYRQMRELLQEDPIWEDGEVMYASHPTASQA